MFLNLQTFHDICTFGICLVLLKVQVGSINLSCPFSHLKGRSALPLWLSAAVLPSCQLRRWMRPRAACSCDMQRSWDAKSSQKRGIALVKTPMGPIGGGKLNGMCFWNVRIFTYIYWSMRSREYWDMAYLREIYCNQPQYLPLVTDGQLVNHL